MFNQKLSRKTEKPLNQKFLKMKKALKYTDYLEL